MMVLSIPSSTVRTSHSQCSVYYMRFNTIKPTKPHHPPTFIRRRLTTAQDGLHRLMSLETYLSLYEDAYCIKQCNVPFAIPFLHLINTTTVMVTDTWKNISTQYVFDNMSLIIYLKTSISIVIALRVK